MSEEPGGSLPGTNRVDRREGPRGDAPQASAGQPRPAPVRRRLLLPLLHGIIVLLVLIELGLGWSTPYWPRDFPYLPLIAPLHISLGITLAGLAVVALLWRSLAASPGEPGPGPLLVRIPLHASVVLLYVLLLLAAAAGYLSLIFAGKPVRFWGLSLPPWGATDATLSALFGAWHHGCAIASAVMVAAYLLLRLLAALWRRPSTASRQTPSQAFPSRDGLVPAPAPDETPPPGDPLAHLHLSLAGNLRMSGALAFWLELPLGLIAILLLFVTASSHYYSQNQLKLPSGLSWGEGIVWAHIATATLAVTIVGFYLSTRWAARLKRGIDPARERQRLRRLIAGINFGSSLGVSLAILGTAFSIALLIAKTVSQPPGIAITDPQKIVRAVDVFVLLANFLIVVAHFIGLLIGLWMLSRLPRSDHRRRRASLAPAAKRADPPAASRAGGSARDPAVSPPSSGVAAAADSGGQVIAR